MKIKILFIASLLTALSANAATYYWNGTTATATAGSNWAVDKAATSFYSGTLTFGASDIYDRTTTTANYTQINFGTSVTGVNYGTFSNTGGTTGSPAGVIDAYWGGTSSVTIAGIVSNANYTTNTRASSASTGLTISLGNVSISTGVYNLGTQGGGVSNGILTGTANVSAGIWNVNLGLNNKYSGAFNSTSGTINISGGSIVIKNGTDIASGTTARGTAALGALNMSGSTSVASLTFGTNSADKLVSTSISNLTVTNTNNIIEAAFVDDGNFRISTLNLNATSADSTLAIKGIDRQTIYIDTMNVTGTNSALLASINEGLLQHFNITNLNVAAGSTANINTINRNIILGTASFDLAGAATDSALLTVSVGTGGIVAAGDYVTLDFSNAELNTTYTVITSSAALTLSDFYVDASQGTLSLSGDSTNLYFTSVPEPAEWAAIFGALALALVVYKRRRR